jgi:hypothetical protein
VTTVTTVLILIAPGGLVDIKHSSASSLQSVGQQRKVTSDTQLKSQTLSRLHARIQIISQQISTLQAQIAATEATRNARVGQLQKILASHQPGGELRVREGSALPVDGMGFRRTPVGATLSINGAGITLAPASLTIKGVQQIVLQANIIHFKSPLLQLNGGNRSLAGLGDLVTGALAIGPMGIPIASQYVDGHIVTGSTGVLVP